MERALPVLRNFVDGSYVDPADGKTSPVVGPHGGFGHSRHGKDLSMYGLEEYTRVKHVMSFLG